MKPPAPPPRSLQRLRELTPARVGLGRAGASLPTEALLGFTLDHARARDAVLAAFNAAAIISGLNEVGLKAFEVASGARDRQEYLRRPDLGRTLDRDSRRLLAGRSSGPCRLALVVGDGLSPTAVNAHAVALVRSLVARLAVDRLEIGHPIVATGARRRIRAAIGPAISPCALRGRSCS